MRLGKIDLNLFVVFDAVYQERNVTKVATRLNLTQPAVSNALNRLRETFDDQLFIRTSEGMVPTPIADSVVNDVSSALTLLGNSVSHNAKFDPENSEKVFQVAMNDLAESLLMSDVHLAVQAQAPNISIASYYINRTAAVEDLKSGVNDLLIDIPTVNAKNFESEALMGLPYVCAYRKGGTYSRKKLTIKEYLKADHIHVSSRRKGRGQVDIALDRLGLTRTIKVSVKDYLVASKMTSETDLLWTVPKALAETLPLDFKSLPFDVAPLELRLFWHKSASADPANRWLRNVLIKIAHQSFKNC